MSFKRIGFIIVCILISTVFAEAQCPMCRMSVESNMQNSNGSSIGSTINTGILYMLAMPYLLVGTLGFIWYRNKKKAEKMEQQEKAQLN